MIAQNLYFENFMLSFNFLDTIIRTHLHLKRNIHAIFEDFSLTTNQPLGGNGTSTEYSIC